ncbi:TetR/AcrR family transcriptional regulator [Microbacterium oryzae]|uniref:TetR/AcrR family transcriptional regulator n=1 Tax=Microbacterium oryzae TaxID=743009 RepID=UPI0025AF57E9|nr:TetR/AcrR family transcriptional regulator [Microbacterium oryzae]MDN3311593.1 TetR/AcrR family transcriptional regulator [Microbacterium oryzae]
MTEARRPTEVQRRSRPGVTARPRGEERRKEILTTAMSLFARGGFHSVSLADIAREVGITQAGILHYFPTKAALLIAVLQERDEQNAAARDILEAAGATPLEAYVEMLAENDRHPELVQLFVILAAESTAHDHPGHAWFQRRNENLVEMFTRWMSEAIDESRLPQGIDAETLARWMLALSHGLGAQWVFDPRSFDRGGSVALFLDFLKPYMHAADHVPAPAAGPSPRKA